MSWRPGPCAAPLLWLWRGTCADLDGELPRHIRCLSGCAINAQRSRIVVVKWSRTRTEDPRSEVRGCEAARLRGSSLEATRRCFLRSWRHICVRRRPLLSPDALATLSLALTTVGLPVVIRLQSLPAHALLVVFLMVELQLEMVGCLIREGCASARIAL